MYKIDEIKMLRLGQRDENLARPLTFDCSDWLEQYPEASIHILFRRPGESAIVPISTTLEGTTLTWLIHDYEVGKTGIGNAEFRAVDTAGLRRKSRIIPCSIEETLLGDDETVLYTQDQVDETLAHISEAAQAAQAAQASEEAAALSAQEAGESAASAGTAADVAVGARDAAQAAKIAAETAQGKAEAAQSGVHADAEAAEQAKVAAQAAQASAQGAASQASADRTAAESARADAEAAATHAEAVVEGIDQAGAAQVAAVNAAGQAQVTAVNQAGTTQVGNVNAAGTTQVNAVQAKGTQVINSIPADYSTLSGDVTDLKSAIKPNISFTDSSYIKYADGTVGSNYSSTKASEYLAVLPGQVFNLAGYVGSENISPIIGLAFYDASKLYVSGVQYDGSNISTVVPSGALFVRFTVYTSCINTFTTGIGLLNQYHDFTLLTSFPYTKSEMEIGVENIGAMPKYSRLIDGITFESGKYVATNGTINSVFYASLSEYIPVENLEMVFAALTNAIPVSFYDKDKTWISNYYDNTVTTYTNATPKKYNITPPGNCKYIRISNVHTALSDNSVYIGEGYGYLKAEQELFPGVENGKYVAVVNEGGVASVGYAQLTDYISVTGLTGFYTSLSAILSACYYDENKTYISGITGTDGESPSWRVPIIPQNAAYIRISNDTRYNTGGIKIIVNLMEAITDAPSEAEIHNLQNQIDAFDTPRNILAMYNDIICIGDSLTWSQVYYSASGQRQAYKPYPNILGSLCGATSHLYATPGDTAILWWERSSTGAFADHGLYIVFLGTNAGFTDTIDTDCVGTNPDNFANTNTGQYGRILQTITNNNDTAVLVLPYGGGGGTAELLATTREVIGKFGAKYNFPVISLDNPARTNAYYHYYPDKSGQNTLHFNDLGYSWVANEICQQINKLSVEDQWKISRKQ